MGFGLVDDISAVFFGGIVTSIFYGVTSIQTYIYFVGSGVDRRLYKVAFACLWILDTIHTFLVVYLVYSFGVVASVSQRRYQPDWRSSVLIFISNMSDLLVRLVFMHRIWLLTRRRWYVLIPIGFMTCLTTGLGCSYGIRMSFRHFTELGNISWQLYFTLSTAVVSDLLITGTLCVLFHRMRSGFERSDSILTKLITYTVSSGLLTSIVAIGTLTTYAVLPDTYIFMSVFFVVSKASFNALLAATNARPHLREKMYGLGSAQQMGHEQIPKSTNHNTLIASLPTSESGEFFPRRLDTNGVVVSSYYSSVGVAV